MDSERIVTAALHWYEAHGRGRHLFKIKHVIDWRNMTNSSHTSPVVVYVGPVDVEIDLEPMKIYRPAAAQPSDPRDYLRVIDESGEDDLYLRKLFEPINVPQRVEAAMNSRV